MPKMAKCKDRRARLEALGRHGCGRNSMLQYVFVDARAPSLAEEVLRVPSGHLLRPRKGDLSRSASEARAAPARRDGGFD